MITKTDYLPYYLLVPLWALIYLLSYSLSIGVLHMHAHRKLFTARVPNRILEFLLCFPCVLSYPMMKYTHDVRPPQVSKRFE